MLNSPGVLFWLSSDDPLTEPYFPLFLYNLQWRNYSLCITYFLSTSYTECIYLECTGEVYDDHQFELALILAAITLKEVSKERNVCVGNKLWF